MAKPIANRLGNRPDFCCGGLRDLEKLGAVVWTVMNRFVFNFDCEYIKPATNPIRYCPFCAHDWSKAYTGSEGD